MSFVEDISYFYYRSSIGELRMMHGGDYSPELSYHSMLYLNIIAGTEDCNVSKLADILKITRSAVTIKVGELVRRGFVEKRRSGADGRVWHLRLTPRLADIYAVFERIGAKTEAALLLRHSTDELALFGRMLREVAEFEWKDV